MLCANLDSTPQTRRRSRPHRACHGQWLRVPSGIDQSFCMHKPTKAWFLYSPASSFLSLSWTVCWFLNLDFYQNLSSQNANDCMSIHRPRWWISERGCQRSHTPLTMCSRSVDWKRWNHTDVTKFILVWESNQCKNSSMIILFTPTTPLAWPHRWLQLKKCCPSDCFPITHPNTKARAKSCCSYLT